MIIAINNFTTLDKLWSTSLFDNLDTIRAGHMDLLPLDCRIAAYTGRKNCDGIE